MEQTVLGKRRFHKGRISGLWGWGIQRTWKPARGCKWPRHSKKWAINCCLIVETKLLPIHYTGLRTKRRTDSFGFFFYLASLLNTWHNLIIHWGYKLLCVSFDDTVTLKILEGPFLMSDMEPLEPRHFNLYRTDLFSYVWTSNLTSSLRRMMIDPREI